jgi:hypothetical protein
MSSPARRLAVHIESTATATSTRSAGEAARISGNRHQGSH